MKYLFFDIECASVSKTHAKICAFGYVLTNERFDILEKREILINPQGRFHLTDRKGEQGIVLPYSYEEFAKQPPFPAFADEIYALLEDKDTFVAGHAVMNDVKYLNLESMRYSLRSFSFGFVDTQFVYMNKIGELGRQFALQTIADALGVDFTPHRAVDDAYATMKIAEAMCKEENLSLPKLVEKYKIKAGRIENYEVSPMTSELQQKRAEESQKRKEEREKAREDFFKFFDKEKKNRVKTGILNRETVCFSRKMTEKSNAKEMLSLVFSLGAFYGKREKCTFFVYADGEKNVPESDPEKIATVLSETEFLEKYQRS